MSFAIELVSVAVGAVGSIISAVTFYAAKKAAKSTETDEKTYVVKNKQGESREVVLNRQSTNTDISKLISENIEYERLVGKYLSQLKSVEVIRNSKHDLGYDFCLNTLSDKYFLEVKANRKPIKHHAIEKLLKHSVRHGSKAVFISKSGYDKSVFQWLKNRNATEQVKLYTAKNASEVRKVLKNIELKRV
ncbi:TPA: restriction endonuclease [Vibrio parahaemolyticus]|nr:restriction endonuclease [Vibrio parahaemolyticus]